MTEQQKPTTTFQTANELLNKITVTKKPLPKTPFDDPLAMQLSRTEELIEQGYCAHCINTKPVEKSRKVTNKLNLFAHYCNVCTALFSVGTEFLTAIKSLDNFELMSLDDDELRTIEKKDSLIYRKIIRFKDQLAEEEQES